MSTVHERKRKLSKLEFYANAVEMRRKIVREVLPGFCVKLKKLKELQELETKKGPEEAEKMEAYRAWVLGKLRDSVYDLLHDMILNITQAYTIWATNLSEARVRRNCQNRAIADCESLMKELEFALTVLPVDANRYMVYVDMIDKEIALLKGWRKSDNKRHESLKA